VKNPEQLIQELDIKDPKIKTSKDILSLSPNYWNFPFITNIICILLIIYIYFRSHQMSEKTIFWSLLSVVLLPIVLVVQLRYYNTVVINFSDKTVSIIPNLTLILFVKRRVIPFKDVKRFETISNSGRPMYRRYIINLILKDSGKIKLISAGKYAVAKQIEEKLSLLLK
jgi:hypothetical protein